MTNKEKANTYAQRNFIREGVITRDSLKKHFEKLLKWKEQQMIEKAVKWLEENQRVYMEYDESGFYHERSQHLIKDFKKAMEEE